MSEGKITDFRDVQRLTVDDGARWFGEEVSRNLTIAVAGMNGEAGETIDVLKKVMRGTSSIDDMEIIEELRNEITDTFIYVLMAAELCDFDVLERYLTHHRPLNEIRFGRKN